MSFFDGRRLEPEPDPVPERTPPEWTGPPRGVLPGSSHQRAILFKTDQAILLVHRFLAFPNGAQFSLDLWLRAPDHEMRDRPWDRHLRSRSESLPDDFLRFGILFPDGAKWTNLDWQEPRGEDPPLGPVVLAKGGGGGGGDWRTDYWLWPLPPKGPLTFVAAWPAHGIAECTVTVDGTELRSRADDAEIIWPD